MKQKITLLFVLVLCIGYTKGQTISIPIDIAGFNIATPKLLESRALNDKERDNLIKETKPGMVTIDFSGIPPGKSIKVNITDLPAGSTSLDITKDLRSIVLSNKDEKRTYVIKLVDAAHPAGQPCGSLEITWTKKATNVTKNAITDAKTKANRKREIDKFMKSEFFDKPYDNKGDKVHLYFDENGRLLNFLPVNVDQNDIFYMHILCVKGDEEKYQINVVQGDYSPSDLAIRPFDKITTFGNSDEDMIEEKLEVEYSNTTRRAGPYTSDYFKFQISYDSSGSVANGPEYKLKINKLFHVGVGVSIVRSNLEAPEYKTYYNGTDTTIEAFNGGSRTLFTFNVIWYWTIFHQKVKGDVIPNGRDVLKDEPTISLTRLYPTIGVTIDNDFKENFFLGAVYEFARGGSLTAGIHYGRISRLKDRNFELGKTKFSGTDADIKLDKEYKSAFYFGLNVDTRIFNLLFSKGQ